MVLPQSLIQVLFQYNLVISRGDNTQDVWGGKISEGSLFADAGCSVNLKRSGIHRT